MQIVSAVALVPSNAYTFDMMDRKAFAAGGRRARRATFIAETACLILLGFIAWHLIDERARWKSFPQGDEGSWMAVAAELSKGNGFTTRWLEHAFLTPYSVPRPDDYRYPAFTCLLAAAFKIWGTDYATAHRLVAALFLLFALSVYLTVRRQFGRYTALATVTLTCFSLLQLMYCSEVYTEGLFGIVVALVIFASCSGGPSAASWWIRTGACIGLLYLVRPNGILFAAGLLAYAFAVRRKGRVRVRWIAAGFLAMGLIMLPWLIRTWVSFGNPFHIAGSAGLLRAAPQDPATYGFLDFTNRYGILYFVKAPVQNMGFFFSLLHEQEHGLELVPLLLCIAGVVRRKRFFNGMILLSFFLTFIGCGYASSMGNWGGVRYFTPLLPFVYAYGIRQSRDCAAVFAARVRLPARPLVHGALLLVFSGVLLWPVYYPHRYYERFFGSMQFKSMDYSAYYAALGRELGPRPFYYAGSLAQINFATDFNCIGMQYFFDSTEIRRAQRTFHPVLMALKPAEYDRPYFRGLMKTLADDGFELTPVAMPDSFAIFVKIKEPER